MSNSWYYVLSGERQGPVEQSVIEDLIQSGSLNDEDYVWRKGFDNWLKLKDVEEFATSNELEIEESMALPDKIEDIDLSQYDKSQKVFYIKVGADRGKEEVEYGPFSIDILIKLYNDNRINAKTFLFTQGLDNWKILAEVKGFEEVFNEVPPPIEESDKRAFSRKPFIARMFIQNNQSVFEGICRDVSIGGMQVLVDNFPAKVGDKISINVHPENTDHSFVASGNIVRLLEGGQGFSFRFVNLSGESVNAINAYISQE